MKLYVSNRNIIHKTNLSLRGKKSGHMLDTFSNSIATQKLFSNLIHLVIIFTSTSMRMQQWGLKNDFLNLE